MARHRRIRRPSRPGLLAMSLLVVAAGAVASRAETWWPPTGPFVQAAAVGEPVAVEPVRVTVHGARAATVLVNGLDELSSGGSWVAVDITAAALTQPAPIAGMAVRDRAGREYEQTDRTANAMVGAPFDPLVPERGEVVFEVPADALGELTLVISPDSPGRTVPRAQAEVPLTVDEAADEPLTPRGRELAP
jgi:hypothetical protein